MESEVSRVILNNISISSYKRLLVINAAVCILYILTAKLGLVLALPPGVATPIWPPSGMALTFVLVFKNLVLPGIFLGSLLVNTLLSQENWYIAILLSITIAFGSTLQAFLAGWALNKFGVAKDLLNSHKSVFYFFSIALVSCLTSSFIGTFALFVAHLIDERTLFNTWGTWWLGDSTGMIVFTPIFLEWAQPFIIKLTPRKILETLLLLGLTLLASLLTFGGLLHKGYPIEYILIPCLLLSVFRLGSQITTLILMLVIIIAVWGTATGYGPFVQHSLNESLILLQSFNGVISATILILIVVLKELQKTQYLLEASNRDLEQKVIERTQSLYEKTHQLENTTLQLRDLSLLLHQKNQLLEKTLDEFRLTQQHALVREKLASLGDLTVGIAHQMRNPLNIVINLAELSKNSIDKWIASLKQKLLMDDMQLENLKTALTESKNNLHKIYEHGKNANSIIETMIKHAQGTSEIYEIVDLHALMDQLVNVSYHSRVAQDGTFIVKFDKHYDASLDNVYVIPQDLSRALINILNNAYDAIDEKKKTSSVIYQPEITLTTSNLGSSFAISLRDNGIGIAQEHLNKIFTPFFTTKATGSAGFGLYITYDLIVQHLGGEVKVDSVKGEYAQFTLILPKLPPIAKLKTENKI